MNDKELKTATSNELRERVSELVNEFNKISYELDAMGYRIDVNPTVFSKETKQGRTKFRALRVNVVHLTYEGKFHELNNYVDKREKEEA